MKGQTGRQTDRQTGRQMDEITLVPHFTLPALCLSRLCDAHIYSNLSKVHKILNAPAPHPLRDFVYSRSVASIRSSGISSIRDRAVSFRRTAFGQSCFTVEATNQWNTPPDVVKSCSSISSF